ncbi:MAG TPA: START domain-containing protein [Chitinophagaceae bacterium]|nr:START domain-containing protein [Chitinophagaceae bacterium]
MKITSIKLAGLVLFSTFASAAIGQYNWKLSKDKDGIKVYQSEVKHSKYKNIKVECTLEGTYDKLMAILNDVINQKKWVYNNINSSILKRISGNEFYYHSETHLPWPMTNRDAIIHLKMNKDSLNRFLKVSAVSVPGYAPEKNGIVRVPRSDISWYVTMPSAKTISIVYIFDAEPGGSLPAWAVNMFTDKGPYESFKKLSELLKRPV